MAFDRSLSRLGYGKGFYDRFLASYTAAPAAAAATAQGEREHPEPRRRMRPTLGAYRSRGPRPAPSFPIARI